MKQSKTEYILKTVRDQKIEFISLWFTDILGFLKSFTITVEELEDTLKNGASFDGSSIEGYARIDESDMFAIPDPDTFRILPWEAYPGCKVARLFCDVVNPDGTAYTGDSRFALRKALREAADMGFTFYTGPEMEFFYFKDNQLPPKPLDHAGYFDQVPSDIGRKLRKETNLALKAFGIPMESSHHEVAFSQHEIGLRYCPALQMADNIMTFRFTVKEIAVKNGFYATFMPKPIFGINGSGMHINMSLFKDGKNAFFDADDPDNLSETGRYFLAGLLKHAREFTAITNQWVNSYKRLTPGYEAPVYISWAKRNRSDLIRIPACKPGKPVNTRLELRSPDPSCNPYLAFSILLQAGLQGIKNKYPLQDSFNGNVFKLSQENLDKNKIKTLPVDLHEAIYELERSEFARAALGDDIYFKFLENKKLEWNEYRIQITEYELKRYFSII